MKGKNVKSLLDYKASKLALEDGREFDTEEQGTLLNNEYNIDKVRNHSLSHYKVNDKEIELNFISEEFDARSLIIKVNADGFLVVENKESE